MAEPANLSDLQTIDQVIARAIKVVDPGVHLWAAAGAGQEVTRIRNAVALNRLALIPRVMRDVGAVDVSTSFVGVPLALPVVMAPVGALALYDNDDALASARAATRMSTSTFCGIFSNSSWEEVAATAPGRHFLQIYVLGDRVWLKEILDRAAAAGFAGICVTVDTPVIGRRDRSLADGFVWSVPREGPPNLRQHGMDHSYRARFTWPDLKWLCEQSVLPVIIKGVLAPADAREAIACGVAGIYVSNHGGRVVDHSVSTIEVLEEIVDAVAGEADVAVDSGFTRGAEVCKALALGARAIGIGRLQCWGLAVGGAEGLTRVLEILKEEISNTMANIGCRTLDDLTRAHVRWSITAAPP